MNQETTTSLIDTALASGSASALDPEERRLQELVLAIRDDVPSPDAGFELRMNARVAAGFPPRRRRRLRMPAFALRRPRMAAMGAAASLLVALAVAVSLGNSDSQSPEPGSTGAAEPALSGDTAAGGGSAAAPGVATDEAAPERSTAPESKTAPGTESAGGSASDSVIGPTPVPPQPGGGFVGGSDRKVQRSAVLALATSGDDFGEVSDQVIAVTDRYKGFVLRSSVTSTEDSPSYGQFELQVPVARMRDALRDLSALADVISRTENADDVTASFVSARTRLEELNAERRGLLRRLEHADSDSEAAAIRARLRIVGSELDAQKRVLAQLRRQTDYAAISVTLTTNDDGAVVGLGDGARDLRDSLVDAANLSLRVLGVAIPLAIVAGLLWALASVMTRRRREAALD